MNPSRSTALENFNWQAGKLRLQAAGKPIDLSAAQAAPALEAFQAFYEEALNAYGAGTRVAPPPVLAADQPGGDAGSSWLNGIRRVFAHVLSWATGKPLPEGRAPAAAAVANTATAGAAAPPKSAVSPTLTLRSVYADPQGVHVVWSHGSSGGRTRETELLYSFESAVAERLQGCYGALRELGVDVVDLHVWRKIPEAAARAEPSAQPGAQQDAKGGAQAARETAEGATTSAARTTPSGRGEKPNGHARVMRLLPGAADNPARALVSPADDEKDVQVLSAPERLIAALHAAADPARPAPERLSYLRCAPSRAGLKVVAVGLGEDADSPGQPARWENIAPWFEAAKKSPAPRPAEPAPDRAPALAGVRRGPEPELF